MQADGGLAGAGGALDAQRGVEVGAHEVVLVGLDGGDDVAHRAHARTFDLRPQQAGVQSQVLAAVEVLVLHRGQDAVGEAEAAAQPHAEPLVGGRAVEGARDRGAPVDHDGVAGGVADVPAPDVEHLHAGPVVAVAVGAAEERWRVGFGVEGGQPLGADTAQRIAGQLVHAVVGEVLGRLAHGDEATPGEVEVGSFGQQLGIVGHDQTTLRAPGNGIPPLVVDQEWC